MNMIVSCVHKHEGPACNPDPGLQSSSTEFKEWCSDVRHETDVFTSVCKSSFSPCRSHTAPVWVCTVRALCRTALLFRHSWVRICFILRVNPIFECTCAAVWRHPRGGNRKITTFSRCDCVRARWKQQETAREAGEIKLFSSQIRVFLECFCLLDLSQACLSLIIITQVLFSARWVFCSHGGSCKQVRRG